MITSKPQIRHKVDRYLVRDVLPDLYSPQPENPECEQQAADLTRIHNALRFLTWDFTLNERTALQTLIHTTEPTVLIRALSVALES